VQRVGLVAAAALLGTLACGAVGPGPRQVTLEFWEALRTGDVAAAEALASVPTLRNVDGLARSRGIEEVLLGEVLEGERSAIVRTSLATDLDGRPLHTTFDTHLVREQGRWRVDVAATERERMAAIFAGTVGLLGEAVGEGIDEFSEALEQGAAEISRAIREALEELEQDRR
jgi:hypothetical protein